MLLRRHEVVADNKNGCLRSAVQAALENGCWLVVTLMKARTQQFPLVEADRMTPIIVAAARQIGFQRFEIALHMYAGPAVGPSLQPLHCSRSLTLFGLMNQAMSPV